MFSAVRILAIRKSRGFSQELLAENSGVSLRTIQRLEQGETVPRGHTLQALAAALGVTLDDFRDELAMLAPQAISTPVPILAEAAPAKAPVVHASPALRSDPDFLQLLNLSALSLLVLPLLNIVVPLLLWRARRYQIEHAAEVGRRVLGFQILWQVSCFFAYLLLAFGHWVAAHYFHPVKGYTFLTLFFVSYALNVLTVGYYAWRLRQGRLELYRMKL